MIHQGKADSTTQARGRQWRAPERLRTNRSSLNDDDWRKASTESEKEGEARLEVEEEDDEEMVEEEYDSSC